MKKILSYFLTVALLCFLSTSFASDVSAGDLGHTRIFDYTLISERIAPIQPITATAANTELLEMLESQPDTEEGGKAFSVSPSIIFGASNSNIPQRAEGLNINEIIFDIPGVKPVEIIKQKETCIQQNVCAPVLDCKFDRETGKFNCEETPKCKLDKVCYRQVP